MIEEREWPNPNDRWFLKDCWNNFKTMQNKLHSRRFSLAKSQSNDDPFGRSSTINFSVTYVHIGNLNVSYGKIDRCRSALEIMLARICENVVTVWAFPLVDHYGLGIPSRSLSIRVRKVFTILIETYFRPFVWVNEQLHRWKIIGLWSVVTEKLGESQFVCDQCEMRN